MLTDAIECPLCLGAGKLKRTEVLDRLGVKDFARVAQLSAEEAIRLLLSPPYPKQAPSVSGTSPRKFDSNPCT